MRDAVEAYLRQGRVEGWADNTVRAYTMRLEELVVFLRRRGCRRWTDVSAADLDAYMRHLADSGRAKNSRVGAAALVRRFGRWLQETRRTVANITRALPVVDDGEPDLPQPPLSEDEVRALLDGLPRRTVTELRSAAAVEMLYGCGLRCAELVAADLPDLDRHQGVLHIRASKAGQERVVPVMRPALAALNDYLAVRRTLLRGPDHGALFLNQYGGRWTTDAVRELFKALNEQRGPDARHLHTHLMRHSIATHLLRGGADVRYIQQFLGHARIDTTAVYLRLVPGRLKEDYDEAMPEIEVGLDR